MQIKNTQTEFGLVTKIFHWFMALLIIGLLALGLYMDTLDNTPDKFKLYGLHKSFGSLALIIVGLRLVWTLLNPHPTPLSDKAIERFAGRAMHWFLYLAVIGMPLSGLIMSSAHGSTVSFFGLFNMPNLVEPDKAIGGLAKTVHHYLAFTLIGAIVLHALAAFKHHFINKDATLRRMLPALVFAMVLGTGGASVAMAAPATWMVDHDQSEISFEAKQMAAPITGKFDKFSADIAFSPDHLDDSHVSATIDIASLNTQHDERDQTIKGAYWFEADKYPTARFVSKTFTKTDDTHFTATGLLSIRDVTVEVELPFELRLTDNGQIAHMTGELMLDRTALDLGRGEDWGDTSIIGQMVKVMISITAHKQIEVAG